MPNGHLSELVEQELEKRGNYGDMEAGLLGKRRPQKSPRKGKLDRFEPADAKGPLRNPLVRKCCTFCTSSALRWMIIIVSLVGALYAYGIAVENGWAPEANVRDNKHVQLVMQRTGEIVDRVRGTTTPAGGIPADTQQEHDSDHQADQNSADQADQNPADQESQIQSLVSTEQSTADEVDGTKQDVSQVAASEKPEEEADQGALPKPQEISVQHHDPVQGLKKLVDVKLESAEKKGASPTVSKAAATSTKSTEKPKGSPTKPESSSAPKADNQGAQKEGKASKKVKTGDEKKPKKKDAKAIKHSSAGDQVTEKVEKVGKKQEPKKPDSTTPKLKKNANSTKKDYRPDAKVAAKLDAEFASPAKSVVKSPDSETDDGESTSLRREIPLDARKPGLLLDDFGTRPSHTPL